MHDQRLFSAAVERNRSAIACVLHDYLEKGASVLEIASGSGEHAVYFSQSLQEVSWQPSDPSEQALASIRAWIAHLNVAAVQDPIRLDVHQDPWPLQTTYDCVFCANMVHIAPWSAAERLFAGTTAHLSDRGRVVLYGPFRFAGDYGAQSNRDFDSSLKARDPAWGIRNFEDLDALANNAGLIHEATIAMPANNHILIWQRTKQR